jgi:hypothetical protein
MIERIDVFPEPFLPISSTFLRLLIVGSWRERKGRARGGGAKGGRLKRTQQILREHFRRKVLRVGERWIDVWAAPALARRLLVVALAGEGVRRALWRPGPGSNVDAGLERGRGRGVLVSERSRDSARTAYLPKN